MKPGESDINPTGSAQGTRPPYTSFTAKEFLAFLLISVLSFSLGYLIGHFIFAGPILIWFTQGGADLQEFAARPINYLPTQLLCCVPSGLPIALVIGSLTFRLRLPAQTTRWVLNAIFAFVAGLVIYIPFTVLYVYSSFLSSHM
jgi:hypothetical protein